MVIFYNDLSPAFSVLWHDKEGNLTLKIHNSDLRSLLLCLRLKRKNAPLRFPALACCVLSP
jgi:hypothetical protein